MLTATWTASTLAAGWQPDKAVGFVVPAGTGGGADQMARLLQGVIQKNKLMKQPLIVINKSGGAGAEGFLAIKDAKGNPDKIVITLSNLFTTPLAKGVLFNWKDLTPVAMLALDQFVLWVNADTLYKTVKDYLAAAKAAGPSKFKMGVTGSKQEDQIITVAIEKARRKVHLHPVQGRRAMLRYSSWASTSTRASIIRSKRLRNGVPVSYGHYACSRACRTKPR